MLATVLLAIGIIALAYSLATPGRAGVERDKITARALEQAKAALIGYALSVDLSTGARPGDLPCPDTNDSGSTGASCGNSAGTSGQTSRIGRLPWKSLGLPDLRDGDGERLWYAVSVNFKYNSRSSCASPGDAGCLNSDTRGTITVRDSSGTVIYDGSNPDAYTPSGVIAVIIAPGGILKRQDGTDQVRDCSGAGCNANGTCVSTATAKCNPVNYLDILSGTENNDAFTDGSSTDGFIQGVIRDAGNNVVVNDKIIVITYNDLMPALERRVAAEVMNCLTAYAATPQANGRYPWAAPVANWLTTPFADQVDTKFGRVPDTFNATFLGAGGAVAGLVCTNIALPSPLCMQSFWPATCGITQGTWWKNWKEIVFYGVADSYKPADPASTLLGVPPPGSCGACGGNSCLLVDPPSSCANKKVVVVVAGKRLSSTAYPGGGGQPRDLQAASNGSNAAYYLEGTNVNGPSSYTYEVQTISSSFSDYLLYQ